jgi:hypothetical protein
MLEPLGAVFTFFDVNDPPGIVDRGIIFVLVTRDQSTHPLIKKECSVYIYDTTISALLALTLHCGGSPALVAVKPLQVFKSAHYN